MKNRRDLLNGKVGRDGTGGVIYAYPSGKKVVTSHRLPHRVIIGDKLSACVLTTDLRYKHTKVGCKVRENCLELRDRKDLRVTCRSWAPFDAGNNRGKINSAI